MSEHTTHQATSVVITADKLTELRGDVAAVRWVGRPPGRLRLDARPTGFADNSARRSS
jgi:hypothetical protein